MKKHKYLTHVKLGDCYEFCYIEGDISHTSYGRIVKINSGINRIKELLS